MLICHILQLLYFFVRLQCDICILIKVEWKPQKIYECENTINIILYFLHHNIKLNDSRKILEIKIIRLRIPEITFCFEEFIIIYVCLALNDYYLNFNCKNSNHF